MVDTQDVKEVEHRRATRAEVSLIARVRRVYSTIEVARHSPQLGVAVMDISTLGLCFLSDAEFNINDLVEVDLSWNDSTISFHGVVRHVHVRAGLGTIGIQFLITQSTKHAVLMLNEWLNSHSDL